jgi:hypothetical protein
VVVINCYNDCPDKEAIAPCYCYKESKDIQCFGDNVESLKLDKLENKSFNTLYIHETNISVINSFGNINFDQIIIQNNSKLTEINENSFKKGPKKWLWISNNTKLDNDLIFKVIRNLETTETIKLTDCKIVSIPPNLFNDKSQVKLFSVSRNKISKISKNTFIGLKNLIEVQLDNNQINKIEDFGFNFTSDGNSDRIIVISLNDNKLNDLSFTSNAFPENKNVSLNINFQNNDFTKIEREIFGPLIDNRKNNLNFANNDMICDCDILWVLEETNETYVSGIDCNEQKKSLYHLKKSDFKCSSIPTTIPTTFSPTTKSTTITMSPNLTTAKTISTNASTTPTTKTITISTITVNKTSQTNVQIITTTTTSMPSKCPPLVDINPCICDESARGIFIQCLGQKINDMNFSKIGPKIKSNTFKYEYIRISGTGIASLTKLVLSNANFNKILIEENQNLEQIDDELFAKSRIESFIIRKNPKLSNSNVFDLAQNLDPLEVILSSNALKEIPENAFVAKENPSNDRLNRISLDNNKIKVITSNAFSGLKNLSYLSLDHNMITTIEDFGLKLSTVSSHLKILLNNNKLNSSSFTLRSTDISDKIELHLNLAENQLTVLSENIFKKIINRNKAEMNLFGNNFNCDCNMKWLLNETLNKNVLNVFCENQKKSLFDLKESDLNCLQCPSVQDTKPCNCDQNLMNIHCDGLDINDQLIQSVGPKIKSNFISEYRALVLTNTNIRKLPKFVFLSANFSQIKIEGNKNLVEIDSQILNKNKIISLEIMNNRIMNDSDVYELAKNLDPFVVNFSNNAIEEIPEFAFVENENSFNNRLSFVCLDHNRIERIHSNAFIGLSNLTHLSLDHNFIKTIEDFGLKLTTIRFNFIKIFLNDNKLDDKSFSSRSFSLSENITVILDMKNNNLTTLNENVFKSIFVKYQNEIILNGNKFLCDCHMKWLLIEPQSKNNQHIECHNKEDKFIFEFTVNDMKCSSGYL